MSAQMARAHTAHGKSPNKLFGAFRVSVIFFSIHSSILERSAANTICLCIDLRKWICLHKFTCRLSIKNAWRPPVHYTVYMCWAHCNGRATKKTVILESGRLVENLMSDKLEKPLPLIRIWNLNDAMASPFERNPIEKLPWWAYQGTWVKTGSPTGLCAR